MTSSLTVEEELIQAVREEKGLMISLQETLQNASHHQALN